MALQSLLCLRLLSSETRPTARSQQQQLGVIGVWKQWYSRVYCDSVLQAWRSSLIEGFVSVFSAWSFCMAQPSGVPKQFAAHFSSMISCMFFPNLNNIKKYMYICTKPNRRHSQSHVHKTPPHPTHPPTNPAVRARALALQPSVFA